MSLHLVQFRPDMARLVRWAHDHKVISRDPQDDLGYAVHALLAANFDTLRPQPFALLTDPVKPATLLAYSTHNAAALVEQAASFALPDAMAALGVEDMAVKRMPDQFAEGRRLGFTVRVRPTVRTDVEGDRNRAREVDAFLAAIAGTPPDSGLRRDAIYADWLRAKLQEGGATVDDLRITVFRLSPVFRRDRDRRLKGHRGPDASFAGTLRVTDPSLFASLLARGVGRHRAFGFGMLLLRPG